MRKGGGNYVKYLKKGCNRREGRGKKFKKGGGKLGQEAGALKKGVRLGAGTRYELWICTIDVIGLYPSIPNKEGLRFLRNVLEKKSKKNVTTDTLTELAELVL